jgi:hypothetical protein
LLTIVADSFDAGGAVLLNLIEAIAIGPSPGSPVEVSESAIFGYGHDSLYQALRRAAEALGEDITSEDWLLKLRKGRLAWLASHPPPPLLEDLGHWKSAFSMRAIITVLRSRLCAWATFTVRKG